MPIFMARCLTASQPASNSKANATPSCSTPYLNKLVDQRQHAVGGRAAESGPPAKPNVSERHFNVQAGIMHNAQDNAQTADTRAAQADRRSPDHASFEAEPANTEVRLHSADAASEADNTADNERGTSA